MSYTTVNLLLYVTRIVSRGTIEAEGEEFKEYWSYKPTGPAPWFIRMVQDPRNVFHEKEYGSRASKDSIVDVVTSTVERADSEVAVQTNKATDV
jgi:AGZA family xanthine/uracil permease-like MFS transporter